MTENTQTLLRQLAEMLDAEKRTELPPERPELVEQWSGRVIHVLRAIQLPGDPKSGGGVYARGATVTISEAMVRASIDRRGNSFFDSLLESDAVAEGPWPEHLDLWADDDDPARTALHRQAVEDLKASHPNASPAMWTELHARFGTQKERAARAKELAAREQSAEAARVRVFGAEQ
jgi:hypothetical protein